MPSWQSKRSGVRPAQRASIRPVLNDHCAFAPRQPALQLCAVVEQTKTEHVPDGCPGMCWTKSVDTPVAAMEVRRGLAKASVPTAPLRKMLKSSLLCCVDVLSVSLLAGLDRVRGRRWLARCAAMALFAPLPPGSSCRDEASIDSPTCGIRGTS